jgi:hypothetical protein
MASETGICNSALIKLGATTITALDDGSANANRCNEQFDKLRDSLLRQHTWNFAVGLVQLAELTTAPAFGYDNAYQLPSDFLRAITVHDNDAGAGGIQYRISGQKLHADASAVYLRYVKIVTDPNVMDPLFRESLSWFIASDICMAVTQSTTLMEAMDRGFRRSIVNARAVDAIEDYPESWPQSSWVTERN